MRKLSAASAVLMVFAAGPAFAAGPVVVAPNCNALVESKQCICATAIVPGQPLPTFTLASVEGNVTAVTNKGRTPITTDVQLKLGDRAIFLDGKGLLSRGPSCQHLVKGNATLTVFAQGGCACANLNGEKEEEAATGRRHNGGLLAGLAVGGGILAIILVSQHPTSPPG